MYVIPFVSGLTTVTFLGISGILWYNFLKAWKGDPGTVIATPDVQMKTIVQLVEKGAEKGTEIGKIRGYGWIFEMNGAGAGKCRLTHTSY